MNKKTCRPGRLSRAINIDKSFYGEDITGSERIWIEESEVRVKVGSGPRIGIDYAGKYWRDIEWRFYII